MVLLWVGRFLALLRFCPAFQQPGRLAVLPPEWRREGQRAL